jgi:transcriptional regulator of met regulon
MASANMASASAAELACYIVRAAVTGENLPKDKGANRLTTKRISASNAPLGG